MKFLHSSQTNICRQKRKYMNNRITVDPCYVSRKQDKIKKITRFIFNILIV